MITIFLLISLEGTLQNKQINRWIPKILRIHVKLSNYINRKTEIKNENKHYKGWQQLLRSCFRFCFGSYCYYYYYQYYEYADSLLQKYSAGISELAVSILSILRYSANSVGNCRPLTTSWWCLYAKWNRPFVPLL